MKKAKRAASKKSRASGKRRGRAIARRGLMLVLSSPAGGGKKTL
jgi:guanylate kinase